MPGTTIVGGGIDGPNYADFYDTADTRQIAAASVVARQDTQMMANNLDLYITQIAGKTRTYASNPDNPVLGYQLVLQRPMNASTGFSQSQLDSRYQSLVNALPQPLKLELEKNSALPPDEQNAKLSAFADFLQNVSLTAVWFDSYEVQDTQGTTAPTVAQVKTNLLTFGNGVVNGLEQVKGNMEAQKNQMPTIDPDRVVLGEYLHMISKLITAAKQFLQELEGLDAKMEQKDAQIQMQQTAARLDKQLKEFDDQMKAKKKQATMKLTMEIVGPVLAALAVIAAVATGGAASILVALVLAALTSADAANGFMSKGLQNVVSSLAESGHMPKWEAEVVMSVMIVVVALLGGAAASTDIGGLMAAEITEQVTEEAAISGQEVTEEAVQQAISQSKQGIRKMMTAQIALTGLSSSGILTDVCTSIAERCTDDKNKQQIIAAILQMIMLLTLMAAGGTGSAKTGGSIMETIMTTSETLTGVIQTGTQAYSAYNSVMIGMIQKEMYNLQGDVAMINTILTDLQTDQTQISQEAQSFGKLAALWGKVLDDIVKGSLQVIQQLTQAS